jgi:hypothetical protein
MAFIDCPDFRHKASDAKVCPSCGRTLSSGIGRTAVAAVLLASGLLLAAFGCGPQSKPQPSSIRIEKRHTLTGQSRREIIYTDGRTETIYSDGHSVITYPDGRSEIVETDHHDGSRSSESTRIITGGGGIVNTKTTVTINGKTVERPPVITGGRGGVVNTKTTITVNGKTMNDHGNR